MKRSSVLLTSGILSILISLLASSSGYGQFGQLFVKKSNKDVKDTLLLQEKSPAFKPKMGRLVDSISIEAIDKSFTIKKGETFKMDKLGIEQRAGWVNPSSDFSKSFRNSDGIPVKIDVSRKIPEYEDIISTRIVNGREVQTPVRRLKGYTAQQDIFYGLLEFNKVHDVCSNDPATRAYFISIPQKYLDAARGGNISVVYEYYTCKPVKKKAANNYTTWVLWISDIEFTK